MPDSFALISPLGISVVLFSAVGAIWVLIGALTYPFLGTDVGSGDLFISRSADTAYFGKPASELLAADPVLSKFRTLLLTFIAGLFLLAGTLYIAIAWFGLGHGLPWALVALTLSGFLALLLWFIALRPYAREGVQISFGDLPPFMQLPALLILPATLLGLIGIFQ
jgi:hypothetical protein